MIIAVIGDYSSPKYKELLLRIKMAKPFETILDLSRHQKRSLNKIPEARFADIANSHQVVIGDHWKGSIDTHSDIAHAQNLHKECFIEHEGQFLPFPEYAERV